MSDQEIKATVRERYGQAARGVASGSTAGWCGGSSCVSGVQDPITSNLYSQAETALLPAEAVFVRARKPVAGSEPQVTEQTGARRACCGPHC